MFKEIVISKFKKEVKGIIKQTTLGSSAIIGRYTAAFAVNFTDWIGKTLPCVRHELAYYALASNLRCESAEDHVGMLFEFADNCDVLVDDFDHRAVHKCLRNIRGLFINQNKAGLNGIVILALLECGSEVFIPDLDRRGKEINGMHRYFRYTEVHGKNDIQHSREACRAVELELSCGYLEEFSINQKIDWHDKKQLKELMMRAIKEPYEAVYNLLCCVYGVEKNDTD